MDWREIAHNDVPVVDGATTVIIGLTPSRGARSPLLWDAAFDHLGIPGRMVPVDCDAASLPDMLGALSADDGVIGGAVTMPHKAAVIPHLAGLSSVASAAGAVNCLARATGGAVGDRELVGENTDGIAALRSLERELGSIDGARVLLLGAGGAGSAVAAAVAGALGREGSLVVANRAADARDALVARLDDAFSADVRAAPGWPVAVNPPDGAFDVIVNATSLGFQLPVPHAEGWVPARLTSPLTGTDGYPALGREEAEAVSAGALGDALARTVAGTLAWLDTQRDALVMDVIYQPERTLLLALAELAGCRTTNGAWMNLEQAVIAFCTAVPAATGHQVDPDDVRGAMVAAAEAAA